MFAFFLIAGVLFWFIAGWVVRSVGECIVGLPGGMVGGAMLGVLGGFAGRMIAEMILSNF